MGGIGRYATVSLLLPPDVSFGWVDALYDGLLERAAEAGVSIVGGNLARSGEGVVVDVTLLGDADRLLLRAGARPGDHVVVTGSLGAAAEGVRLLKEGARLDDDGRAAAPRESGPSLRPRRSSRACARSSTHGRRSRSPARSPSAAWRARAWTCRTGCRPTCSRCARRAASRPSSSARCCRSIPKAAGLARASGGDPSELALHGGEDYQLLLAIAPEALDEARELSARVRSRADAGRQLRRGRAGAAPARRLGRAAARAGRPRSLPGARRRLVGPHALAAPDRSDPAPGGGQPVSRGRGLRPRASSSRSSRCSGSTPAWRCCSRSCCGSTGSRSWSAPGSTTPGRSRRCTAPARCSAARCSA